MTGKTIRVKQNTHSTFFSMIKTMKVKSSDECLKILMVKYWEDHLSGDNPKLREIYKGMYQIEEKS